MATRDKVGEQLLISLAELVEMFAVGRLSPTRRQADSVSSGVRPIVIGECIRALAAKVLLKATDTGELEQLHPLQLGGHAIKGIHTAIFTVRSWVNSDDAR